MHCQNRFAEERNVVRKRYTPNRSKKHFTESHWDNFSCSQKSFYPECNSPTVKRSSLFKGEATTISTRRNLRFWYHTDYRYEPGELVESRYKNSFYYHTYGCISPSPIGFLLRSIFSLFVLREAVNPC